MKNLRLNIFVFFLLVNMLVTGGRLPSSDENAMFLLTKSLATRGAVDIPAGIVDNGSLREGKFYVWYEVGWVFPAIPFYWGADVLFSLLHLPEELRTLFLKAVIGTVNAFTGAGIALFVFMFGIRLGYSARNSFLLSIAVCLSSFLFPYFKSFTRDPLLTLYTIGALYYLHRWSEGRHERKWLTLAGIFCGLGLMTKVTFAITIAVLFLFVLLLYRGQRHSVALISRAWWAMLIPIFVGGLGVLAYNYARFGNILDLGYTAGTSFTTPLYVGLYGLLFSSGKGIFIFAPVAILGLFGFAHLKRKFPALILTWYILIAVSLLFHAKYVAWGGDGSWGPRYLCPLVPLLILPVGELLEQRLRKWKLLFMLLLGIGIFIQAGGTTIYTGTYLREIGEFPYARRFEDPEFLYRAHFIPDYSPIVWHWMMAARNTGELLSSNAPSLVLQKDRQDQRIPLDKEGRSALLHTLDYWFTYPYYVGYRSMSLVLAPLVILAVVIGQGFRVQHLLNPAKLH